AGTQAKDLTESQKTMVSALGTLAAGLAGGLAGGDVASAVAGAQAGKNAVENNWLSKGMMDYGNSQTTLATNTNLVDENGNVINPSTAEQIQYGKDKLVTGKLTAGQQPATGLVKAWGAGMSTVVAPLLLPATATTGSILAGGAISGVANVSNQVAGGGPLSVTDALIAAGTGAVTEGKGFWFAEAASITGAYAGAKLQGKDVLPAVVGAGFGTAVGVAGGKTIEVGNKYFPLVSDKTAGMAGAVSGSIASEITSSKTESKLKEAGDNK
ncbi:VENN motif pre-toxin domain-containing protein, partial [Biostraticola tofi]